MAAPEWATKYGGPNGTKRAIFETEYAQSPIIITREVIDDENNVNYRLYSSDGLNSIVFAEHAADEEDHVYMRVYNGLLCIAGPNTITSDNGLTMFTLNKDRSFDDNVVYSYVFNCDQPYKYEAMVSEGCKTLNRSEVDYVEENVYSSIAKDAINNKFNGWVNMAKELTFYETGEEAYANMQTASDFIDAQMTQSANTITIECFNGSDGVDSLEFDDGNSVAANSGQTEALAQYHGTSENYKTEFVGSYKSYEEDNEAYMWLVLSIGEDGTGRYEYGDTHGKVIPVEDENNNRFKFISDYDNSFEFTCVMKKKDGKIYATVSNNKCIGDVLDLVVRND